MKSIRANPEKERVALLRPSYLGYGFVAILLLVGVGSWLHSNTYTLPNEKCVQLMKKRASKAVDRRQKTRALDCELRTYTAKERISALMSNAYRSPYLNAFATVQLISLLLATGLLFTKGRR